MKPVSAGSAVLLAAFVVVAARLLWLSRGWPLVHDAPIMHYVAWRIGEGAVPYRDVFDMNFPGVYLVHLALLRTLGAGDLAWRLFDLGWLAVAAAAVAALAAPWGVVASAGGALFFVVHHLANGAWQAGQRDFLLCPFLLLGAAGVARWSERASPGVPTSGLPGSLALAGLALGAGATLKPQAVGLLLGFALLIVWREGRESGRPLAALLIGAAAPIAAVVAWVAAAGGLAAWRAIVMDYLLPLYSRLGRPASWAFHRWEVWIPMAVAVVVALAQAGATRRFTPRHGVVGVGVAYGLAHFFAQGKGWEYHLYPLAAFSAVALFSALEPLTLRRPASLVVAASLAAVVVLLALKGAEASHPAWLRAKERRVASVVRALDGRLAGADTVQVLDTTAGGIHALLRLHAREPSRFVYDFHFFHDPGHPTIRALRAELAAALAAHPPRFVVLFEEGWPGGGYERVDGFPALARLLADYTVDASGDGYRVLARRDAAAAAMAATAVPGGADR